MKTKKLLQCLSSNYYDNIITRATLLSMDDSDDNDTYASCPVCGCDTAGDTYTIEERSWNSEDADMMICRACSCVTGANDDYEDGLSVNCDDSDPYSSSDDTVNCPSTGKCFVGVSTNYDGSNPEYSSTSCSSDDDEYCGLTFTSNVFENKYEWDCQDRYVICCIL